MECNNCTLTTKYGFKGLQIHKEVRVSRQSVTKRHRRYREHKTGTIFKTPEGKIRGQYSLEGKRISKTFTNYTDAESWFKDISRRLNLGYGIEKDTMTVEEYLNFWFSRHKEHLRPKTIIQYEDIITRYIIPGIGKKKLVGLSVIGIEDFYAEMRANGVKDRTRKLSHSVLRCALEKAKKYGYITNNPADSVEIPKYKHKEMKVLDAVEVNQLLTYSHNHPDNALYFLAITTGMRMGELFALRWSDINFQSGELYIRRQILFIPGEGNQEGPPKTDSGIRTVELSNGAIDALQRHRDNQELLKVMAGAKWKEQGLVFASSVGTSRNPTNTRKIFNKVLADAGINRIRFHDMRHTAASLLLNAGVPLLKVSKMLGHSKPSTTLDIYAHLIQDKERLAAKTMDKLVSPTIVEIPQIVLVQK